MPLRYTQLTQSPATRARLGRLTTRRSEMETPIFMPVGTHASVRGVPTQAIDQLGYQLMLGNTYHLFNRPGLEVFRKLGGVQNFMRWGRSILTDSGGYQVFSLARERTINEEGVSFRGFADGKKIHLSPERCMEAQHAINSDIMMVLDECVASTSSLNVATAAMERTYRWALRSLAARKDSDQALFAIVQGACFEELRKKSAESLTQHPFDGFAVGGLAVGEEKHQLEDITAFTTPFLPQDKPRYLMGVGTPLDILEAVHRGIDMFDCVLPTMMAQQGVAYTSRGRIDLRRGVYRALDEPLDPQCPCVGCTQVSRGYLHHLLEVEEPMLRYYVGLHNLTFYAKLMQNIRESLRADKFLEFYTQTRAWLGETDLDFPVIEPKVNPRRKKSPTQLGEHEVVKTKSGSYSLKHLPSGEIMHSVNVPEEETEALYIGQSRLRQRLHREKKLVVWDVGLGLGFNAMATLRAAAALTGTGELELISFEKDLDTFRLGLYHTNKFPHLRHPGARAILHREVWQSTKSPVSWKLISGDFTEKFNEAPTPDIIFFDPYSSKTNSAFWTYSLFQNLFEKCRNHPTTLFTYTNSTAIRAALLAAGFLVARGVATGPKTETTIALSPKARSLFEKDLLNEEWMQKWQRSGSPYPIDIHEKDRESFSLKLVGHEQFRKLGGERNLIPPMSPATP